MDPVGREVEGAEDLSGGDVAPRSGDQPRLAVAAVHHDGSTVLDSVPRGVLGVQVEMVMGVEHEVAP